VPEGDSVWRAANQLHTALAGQKLLASDFRVPRFATLNLAGWTMEEVVPRGKHLLMRLTGPGQERLTIHSHLKMEGSWQIYPPGGRWRKPGFTARCVLRTAAADAVGFSLGLLEVIKTSEEDKAVGFLGPDLLGPDWDPVEAERRVTARPDVPVGVALLDQSNLAGIGNIYRCEVCFLAGIHPASPVAAVKDWAAMFADAKQLLEANLGAGRRTTLLNARGTPVGRAAGRPGYWVYRREHQPCLRCRTPIRHAVLGKSVPGKSGTGVAAAGSPGSPSGPGGREGYGGHGGHGGHGRTRHLLLPHVPAAARRLRSLTDTRPRTLGSGRANGLRTRTRPGDAAIRASPGRLRVPAEDPRQEAVTAASDWSARFSDWSTRFSDLEPEFESAAEPAAAPAPGAAGSLAGTMKYGSRNWTRGPIARA
jgi:endonuclease-8